MSMPPSSLRFLRPSLPAIIALCASITSTSFADDIVFSANFDGPAIAAGALSDITGLNDSAYTQVGNWTNDGDLRAIGIGNSYSGGRALYLDALPYTAGYAAVAQLDQPVDLNGGASITFNTAVRRTTGLKNMFVTGYDSAGVALFTVGLVDQVYVAAHFYSRTALYYNEEGAHEYLDPTDLKPWADSYLGASGDVGHFASTGNDGWGDSATEATSVTIQVSQLGFNIALSTDHPGLTVMPQQIRQPLANQGGGGNLASLRFHTGLNQTQAGWYFDNLQVVGTVEQPAIQPRFSGQPQNTTALLAGTASFAATVEGVGPLSYQWFKDGQMLPGKTSDTLSLTNAKLTDTGEYSLLATNAYGETRSAIAQLTINGQGQGPKIYAQPTSQTLREGEPLVLRVSAASATALTYQWQRNGEAITGATNPRLEIAAAEIGDAGVYRVLVDNPFSRVISATALVGIVPPESGAISSTSQQLGVAGGSYRLAVDIAESWSFETPPAGVRVSPLSGTGPGEVTVMVSPNTTEDRRTFSLIVNGTTHTITQTEIQGLRSWTPSTITSGSETPSAVIWNGKTFLVKAGGSTYASVDGAAWNQVDSGLVLEQLYFLNGLYLGITANGEPQVSADFQTWVRSEGLGTSIKAFAANDAFFVAVANDKIYGSSDGISWQTVDTLSGVSLQTVTWTGEAFVASGYFASWAWSSDGRTWISGSAGAPLGFNDVAGIPGIGAVTVGPLSGGLAYGGPLIGYSNEPANWQAQDGSALTSALNSINAEAGLFVAVGDAGTASYSFDGQTWNTLDLGTTDAIADLAYNGERFMAVTSSGQAYLSGRVGPDPETFQLTESPHDTELVLDGPPTELSVAASGTDSRLTYQWRHNKKLIPGATGATLILSATFSDQTGSYDVIVSGPQGSELSAPAKVTLARVPLLVDLTGELTGLLGEPWMLTTNFFATGEISYQWLHNGNPIPEATSATYAVTHLSFDDEGTYSVTATNAAGFSTLPDQNLVVNQPARFTSEPDDLEILIGQDLSLVTTFEGKPTPSIQWFKDEEPLIGATAASYILSNATADNSGTYRAVLSGYGGTKTSRDISVEVVPPDSPATVLVAPQPANAMAGDTIRLAVTATGYPAPTYQWYRNGQPVGTNDPEYIIASFAATDTGFYTVHVSNRTGETTPAPVRVTLATEPSAPRLLTALKNQYPQIGSSVTFQASALGVPTVSYEWRHDGVVIAGATGSTLTLDDISTAEAGSYTVRVTNGEGEATSNSAQVRVITQTYAGVYFGTFGANRGSFALTIGPDNTGYLLGFDQVAGFYVSTAVAVDDQGNFTVSVEIETAEASASKVRLAAARAITLSGQIDPVGTISGSVDGIDGISLTGTRSSPGSTVAVAGYYEARQPGGLSGSATIVSPDGKALTLLTDPNGTDGGEGTVASNGALSVQTAGGKTLVGTLNAAASTIISTLTTGSESIILSGGNSATKAQQRLVNISTRAQVGSAAGEEAIAGISIGGTDAKTVLIRAVGPTLASLKVPGGLPRPKLELHHNGEVLATNNGWANSPNPEEIISASARAFAFPLAENSTDAAIVATLQPGLYTAVAVDQDRSQGVVLIEVYDLSTPVENQQLLNISSRALVGTGDDVCIAGFAISGPMPKTLLVRGIGPSLAKLGVEGELLDPQLEIYQGETVIATNDDWVESDLLTSATESTYAFELVPGSKDAALVITLAPGLYTAILRGAHETTGIGLVEVYEFR